MTQCTKLKQGHKTLLPGLFLLHCPHGIPYGYEVKDDSESPNIPFSVSVSRFQVAPKIVIYDNACALPRCALNRNPGFFRETKFLVDRFHWHNHTGCCGGYNINAYDHLKTINTQVAGQQNATLVKLKSFISYQHQDNFFLLQTFLSFRNMTHSLQLREALTNCELIIKQLVSFLK
ncbi:uncharacterized protein [Watersipora subatra]|uniref:uncharacterized protein isoform X1 n=1 Tax=Watersipora subatra TaxID=2589382 RepID=UPI00355B55EF